MKKLVLAICITFSSFSLVAQTNTGNLPAAAKNFIEEHFSSSSISEVKENSSWQIWEDEKFEVSLSNGIEIDFDENGNAIEIDSNAGEAIPLTALPSKIADYLNENYADVVVISWEKSKNDQEVELENGVEIEFDADANFIKLD